MDDMGQNNNNHSSDYDRGLMDGRFYSLEHTVKELTQDVRTLKISIYMLYGAIAVVQFFPELRSFLNNAAQ